MKRSEKLLDAIGQIDDRLVEKAADAGAAPADIAGKKEKKRHKRAALYRWQGALAACAVMAVCAGVFGLLARSGILLSPFEAGSSQAPMEAEGVAMDYAAARETTEEAKAEQEAAMEEAGETDKAAAAKEPEAIEDYLEEGQGRETKETAKVTEEMPEAEQSGRSADEGASMQSAEYVSPADMDISENVVITVTESGAESVTFTMENKTSGAICFGEAYELEQYADGIWQTVPPKAEVCWKELQYTVEEGNSFHQTVNFGTIYGALAPGQYRLVKYYERAEGKEQQGQESYPAYVEFTVPE